MYIEITRRVAVEVCSVQITVPVNYEEEDMPNNFPGRDGDQWSVIVNLHNGDLSLSDRSPFPKDATLELHMKVCNSGIYRLLDDCGDVMEERAAGVPGFFPGPHYGDYLILDIADGKVENWNMPCADDVAEAFQEQ